MIKRKILKIYAKIKAHFYVGYKPTESEKDIFFNNSKQIYKNSKQVAKLTYKDFKIGQKVTCVKIDDTIDEHLTVGKTYKINDLDFHFHDKMCVKSDRKIYMFFKIEYFEDIKMIRKLKIENIQKNIKK